MGPQIVSFKNATHGSIVPIAGGSGSSATGPQYALRKNVSDPSGDSWIRENEAPHPHNHLITTSLPPHYQLIINSLSPHCPSGNSWIRENEALHSNTHTSVIAHTACASGIRIRKRKRKRPTQPAQSTLCRGVVKED